MPNGPKVPWCSSFVQAFLAFRFVLTASASVFGTLLFFLLTTPVVAELVSASSFSEADNSYNSTSGTRSFAECIVEISLMNSMMVVARLCGVAPSMLCSIRPWRASTENSDGGAGMGCGGGVQFDGFPPRFLLPGSGGRETVGLHSSPPGIFGYSGDLLAFESSG